jgi:hypothetical protein
VRLLGEEDRAMMGERLAMQESLFYEFRLEEHVPPDHLLRRIDHFVDCSELRQHLAGSTAPLDALVRGWALVDSEKAEDSIAEIRRDWPIMPLQGPRCGLPTAWGFWPRPSDGQVKPRLAWIFLLRRWAGSIGLRGAGSKPNCIGSGESCRWYYPRLTSARQTPVSTEILPLPANRV